MANRFPLIVDSDNQNIKEIPSGDNLDLTGNDALFGDNDKAIFGTGSDLQIYHDGSNSWIKEEGTGSLVIRATDFFLQSGVTGESYISALLDGAVTLHYDDIAKLATTATGVDITGIADASTLFRFGVDNSEIANNYLRFKPSGDAYIDHNTVGQAFNFRVSASSALDTTPLVVSSTGIDVTGAVTADGLTVDGNSSVTGALDVGGDLGLGSKLDVYSASYQNLAVLRSVPSDGVNPYLAITSSSSGITLEENGSSYANLMFKTGGSEAMRIDAAGNVGINEQSPDAYLHVSGMEASSASQGAIFEGSWPWLKFLDTELNQSTWSLYNDNALYFTRLAYADRNNAPNSGVDSLILYNTQTVFNEDAADIDFRVESVNFNDMLFVDASTDAVGIGAGTALPTTTTAWRHLFVGGNLSFMSNTTSNEDVYMFSNMYYNNAFTVRNDGKVAYLRMDDGIFYYAGSDSAQTAGAAASFNNFLTIHPSNEAVFNQDGLNHDFRVESDGNAYALFVDAGNDVIGVGTSTPATYVGTGGLAVKGSSYSDLALVASSVAVSSTSHQLRFYNEAGSSYEIARTRVNVGAGQVNRGEFQFSVNNGAALRPWLDVNYNGDVVFNDEGHDSDFRVESVNNPNMFVVDASVDGIGIGGGASSSYTLDISGKVRINASQGPLQIAGTGYVLNPEYLTLGRYTTTRGYIQMPTVGGSGAIEIWDGGTNVIANFGTTEISMNSNSADRDFRVASESNSYMLSVDAGQNVVKIGTSNDPTSGTFPSPSLYLKQTSATIGFDGIQIEDDGTTAVHGIGFTTAGDFAIASSYRSGTTYRDTVFNYGTNSMLRIATSGSGETIVNDAGIDVDFRVESDNDPYALMVDASLDSVGVGAQPTTGSTALTVASGITQLSAQYDPVLGPNISNGSQHSAAIGGTIRAVYGWQGTGRSGSTFVIEYASASWKSYTFEIQIASTRGLARIFCGGYNNAGLTNRTYTYDDDNMLTSVVVTTSSRNGTNQGQTVTITMSGNDVHPMMTVKYSQTGGDGVPRGDRLYVTTTF